MAIKIPIRRREDALVPDAVKPIAPVDPYDWVKDFPGPNAKRAPCNYCGGSFIRGCKEAEHKGCLNFQTAQKRKERAKS
jgi:hypothetical protein